MLALRRDPENLSVIPRSHVEVAAFVEDEVPDIFGAGLEIDGCTPEGIGGRLVCGFLIFTRRGGTRRGWMISDFVNLAVGIRGRVDDSALIHGQRLHLKLLRLEDHSRFAVGSNSINARGRTCGSIKISPAIRRNRPDISRWRRGERRESRSQFQPAGATYGYAFRCALDQFVEFRLFPGARAFGKNERKQKKQWKDNQHPTQTDQVHTSDKVLGGEFRLPRRR